MIPDWLLKLTQLAIMFTVSSAAIYWQWTDNNFLIVAWGGIAAYAFTLAYVNVVEWFIERRLRRQPMTLLTDDDERWP